jgi:hypothetical protein
MSRAEEMRDVFSRWEKSGLSLLAFGKAEAISYATLQYWRRKFRGNSSASRTKATRVSPNWAEVRIVPDSAPTDPSTGYEVWLANGVSLKVRAGFDANELRRLLEVLATC